MMVCKKYLLLLVEDKDMLDEFLYRSRSTHCSSHLAHKPLIVPFYVCQFSIHRCRFSFIESNFRIWTFLSYFEQKLGEGEKQRKT